MRELIPYMYDTPSETQTLAQCELKALYESNKIEGEFQADRLIASAEAWLYMKGENVLTLDVILTIHKILMQPTTTIDKRDKGAWRRYDITIAGRLGTPFQNVPYEIERWLKILGDAHHLDSIQEAHVAYERIHPFADGNGRTGRMIMNWQLMKSGFPIAVILAENKHEYYQWF